MMCFSSLLRMIATRKSPAHKPHHDSVLAIACLITPPAIHNSSHTPCRVPTHMMSGSAKCTKTKSKFTFAVHKLSSWVYLYRGTREDKINKLARKFECKHWDSTRSTVTTSCFCVSKTAYLIQSSSQRSVSTPHEYRNYRMKHLARVRSQEATHLGDRRLVGVNVGFGGKIILPHTTCNVR